MHYQPQLTGCGRGDCLGLGNRGPYCARNIHSAKTIPVKVGLGRIAGANLVGTVRLRCGHEGDLTRALQVIDFPTQREDH